MAPSSLPHHALFAPCSAGLGPRRVEPDRVDRRTFMKSALAGAGVVAAGSRVAGADPVNIALPSLGLEPLPARTPVQHLVVVMMENRSADHYLGWYGAERSEEHTSEPSHSELSRMPSSA